MLASVFDLVPTRPIWPLPHHVRDRTPERTCGREWIDLAHVIALNDLCLTTDDYRNLRNCVLAQEVICGPDKLILLVWHMVEPMRDPICQVFEEVNLVLLHVEEVADDKCGRAQPQLKIWPSAWVARPITLLSHWSIPSRQKPSDYVHEVSISAHRPLACLFASHKRGGDADGRDDGADHESCMEGRRECLFQRQPLGLGKLLG